MDKLIKFPFPEVVWVEYGSAVIEGSIIAGPYLDASGGGSVNVATGLNRYLEKDFSSTIVYKIKPIKYVWPPRLVNKDIIPRTADPVWEISLKYIATSKSDLTYLLTNMNEAKIKEYEVNRSSFVKQIEIQQKIVKQTDQKIKELKDIDINALVSSLDTSNRCYCATQIIIDFGCQCGGK